MQGNLVLRSALVIALHDALFEDKQLVALHVIVQVNHPILNQAGAGQVPSAMRHIVRVVQSGMSWRGGKAPLLDVLLDASPGFVVLLHQQVKLHMGQGIARTLNPGAVVVRTHWHTGRGQYLHVLRYSGAASGCVMSVVGSQHPRVMRRLLDDRPLPDRRPVQFVDVLRLFRLQMDAREGAALRRLLEEVVQVVLDGRKGRALKTVICRRGEVFQALRWRAAGKGDVRASPAVAFP